MSETATKRSADLILSGATIVTMDDARNVYTPGAVAISGNAILAVGPQQEILASYSADELVTCDDRVIIPGLVNAHTHLPMSLLRGLADDLRLDVWLNGYILPVEREFVNPEFSFLGTQLSCAEMLLGGTTCFADMYYHEQEIAWAVVQAGMRGICGETILKFPTPDAPDYAAALQYCADFMSNWQGHELIVAAPAPHSPDMCPPEILHETTKLALQYDVPQLIHVSETAFEVEEMIQEHAMPPARWLEEQGVLESRVVAAHCVHLNLEEMHLLQNHGVGIAHNPSSNLKLASGVAPIKEMLELGLVIGVGTDGAASNNDLDMFEEMRLAALLSKGVSGSPTAVPAAEALAMATIYGARALSLDEITGSLEAGKRADLVVLTLSEGHAVPHFETTGQNIYSRLVYTAQASDVRDVYVNGQQVVADRQVLTIDLSATIEHAKEMARRINQFFVQRERSVLDKLIAIGGLEQQETFEVQAKGRAHEPDTFEERLHQSELIITAHTSRDQYDTYFEFSDPEQGRLRYREDNVIQADGSLEPLYTLTLTGPAREAELGGGVLLSRSRYTAPAPRSLRFYREYFDPKRAIEIAKRRERYHIRYKGLDFAVNLDHIETPKMDAPYVEIKSRTWSEQDAARKASLIGEILEILGAQPEDMLQQEYVDLFED